MTQRFQSGRYPFLNLTLTVGSHSFHMEALADTGFDGDVIVPANTLPGPVRDLERVTWRFPDGSEVEASSTVGQASVAGLNSTFAVVISEMGHEALAGRGVLDRFKITLDHGRTLTIEP